jgi:hypothetical protein
MVRCAPKLRFSDKDVPVDTAVGAAVGRRGAILLGMAAMGALQPPRPASATPFSAAGNALFMNLNLNPMSIQSWLQLNPEQQQRRAKALAPERAKSLTRQLDDLLSELPDTPVKEGMQQLKAKLQPVGEHLAICFPFARLTFTFVRAPLSCVILSLCACACCAAYL